MKTNWKPIKAMLIAVGVLVTATAFGQTVYAWTGAANGTNLSTAGNWTTNGIDPASTLPSGNNGTGIQDTARWDGRTMTNLVIGYQNPSLPSTGFGSIGINLHITPNQTNSVQIRSSQLPASPAVGIKDIFIDAGAGAFTLGDDNTPNNLTVYGRPNGAVHHYVNNSTKPATFGRSIRWWIGGTSTFSGTGDWIVNNYLLPEDSGFSPTYVQVDGPGTVVWSAGKTNQYNPITRLEALTINGGKLILKSSGLLIVWGNQQPDQPITNNGTLVFDAPLQSQLQIGIISGSGQLVVSNGTLTLGGASVYTGNTLLAGGTLVVNGPEIAGVSGPLGQGNTITFAGGTLGYSPDNFWDYSDRFDPSAGQFYRVDTAGQSVTFTNNLASSGGTFTKLGVGTLTLAGSSSYSGATTISEGKLVFQSAKSGTGNITLADGTTLGIVDNGIPITPDTLTLGTSSGCTLEFDNVNSTATAPLSPTALAATGPVTIQINSGTFVTGQSYPLLTWTSGAAPTVALNAPSGFSGSLSFAENTLRLNVTSISAPKLNCNIISNDLRFTWDNGFGSFKLQAQTNSLSMGLVTNWTDYPVASGSPVMVPIDAMNETVFFRLASQP